MKKRERERVYQLLDRLIEQMSHTLDNLNREPYEPGGLLDEALANMKTTWPLWFQEALVSHFYPSSLRRSEQRYLPSITLKPDGEHRIRLEGYGDAFRRAFQTFLLSGALPGPQFLSGSSRLMSYTSFVFFEGEVDMDRLRQSFPALPDVIPVKRGRGQTAKPSDYLIPNNLWLWIDDTWWE